MRRVSVKAKCTHVAESGEGDHGQTRLVFSPDYQDGANKEWATATPCFSMDMTVVGDELREIFVLGRKYTVYIEGPTE